MLAVRSQTCRGIQCPCLRLPSENRTSIKKGEYQAEKTKLKRRESKLKLKLKRKLEKAAHLRSPAASGAAAAAPVNGDVHPKTTKTKPIFNKDGKMVYSKFDFTDTGGADSKAPKSEFTGKNYKNLLAKVEKRNEKLQKLKESNPEKGQQLEEKIKWQAVLNRAEGLKVKDNPDMLKKAAKAKDKKRQQRQKKWDSRKETTEKQMEERQAKRKLNIRAQKQANIEKKVKKLKKKGRLIPGF